MIYTPQPP